MSGNSEFAVSSDERFRRVKTDVRGDVKLPYTREFWPTTVLVTEEAKDDPLTHRVLSRLGVTNPEVVTSRVDPLSEKASPLSEAERFSRGKRQLLLTRHHGGWLERCPGTQEHVCCNLLIVNPGEGCPLDCTYCYLQHYLRRNPTMKLFTNTGDLFLDLERSVKEHPGKLFRVGTGEVMDSLVWDDLTDFTLEAVPFVARHPNLLLELRTKFDWVENLIALKHEHRGQTVVSWSINAPQITEHDEAFTASLDRRIAAAERVIDAGYRVGFHFDPLIYFSGFEDGYRDTIERIFRRIQPESIAWISVSTLRYKPEMQDMMMTRFPESAIPFGEQVLGADNKQRYLQPLRMRMERFVWNELKARSPNLPLYMCMESAAVWKDIAGTLPGANPELTELFTKRGRLPVLPAQ